MAVVSLLVGVLDLITYSSNDFDSSEDPSAPEHASSTLTTSLFLHSSDSSKTSRDSAVSGSLKRPPLLDSHEATISRWRSKVVLRSSSPSSPTHALPSTVISADNVSAWSYSPVSADKINPADFSTADHIPDLSSLMMNKDIWMAVKASLVGMKNQRRRGRPNAQQQLTEFLCTEEEA
ncbi:hypothetical protein Tco_0841893 [Tanacetum coccineum]|uniref:Uncharacterized protein n=1 Tax=Tanacetum coccineum TaxID=301880 RepID=A0ABQ5AXP1_9ASTR